jgi:chemotaxis protein MotB
MTEDKPRPIVLKKKVKGHGGHHGGAWKVAYADFVTAMMALFIVLWLMNSNAKVKEAVSGYFRDPAGVGKMAGTDKEGRDKTIVVVQKDNMEALKQEVQKTLAALPHFQEIKDLVAITVTREGLRIELMETESGMFFESGSPKPSETGVNLLRKLAAQLGKLPNRILIEGHTDARPFTGGGHYGNWELSSDRANQARVIMQAEGLRDGQVFQVRGYADQQLRDPKAPNNPSNRRISVIVQYQTPPDAPASAPAEAPAKSGIEPAKADAEAAKPSPEPAKPSPEPAKH